MSNHRKTPDRFGAVLRETVESFKAKDNVDVMTVSGLHEVLAEPALWRSYKAQLCEAAHPDTREALDVLFDNFRVSLFREAALSSIEPTSTLTMPMLRKAWPKIGAKEALPTEPVKTPKFTVSYLSPYLIDPVTGLKQLLPQYTASEIADGGSQKQVSGAATALPLNAYNVMPSGCPVSAGYTLDPIFSVVAVDVQCYNAAGSVETTQVGVKVYNGQSETRLGNIRATVTVVSATDGNTTSDTLFGYVDYANGVVTLTSLGAAGATATQAKITNVYFQGQIESTSNKQSTQVGFDVTTTEIAIGTGEHFDAALPLEWLQDNLAMYNVDGTLKVVDIMTELMANRVDIQALQFIQSTYSKGAAINATNFSRTFDVYPTGNYNGSPTEWLNELRRITDNLAQSMKNFYNFGGGTFVILGNPIDVQLFVGVEWIFTAQSDQNKDGVEVNYSIGALSGAQRYVMFSSQNYPQGSMSIFFIPGPEDQKNLTYYPYTFNVERSSSGFVSPNTPNTPSVMMTKRQQFKDFLQIVGVIQILHNDGTLPT
jgi:hypothetical protein